MLTDGLKDLLADRLRDVEALVGATNKSSVLVVTQFPCEEDIDTLVPAVRESLSNVLAFVELGSEEVLEYVLEHSDGVFDAIVMDSDHKFSSSSKLIRIARDRIRNSKLFFYSDESLWSSAAVHFIDRVENGLLGKKTVLIGNGQLARKIAIGLHETGADVFLYDEANELNNQIEAISLISSGGGRLESVEEGFDWGEVDVAIGGAVKRPCINSETVEKLGSGVSLYDMGIGTISSGGVLKARERGFPVFRVDNRAGVSGLILSLFEADYLVDRMMGKAEIRGIEIVAGGVLGKDGAVVVDNANDPSYLIGLADGAGRLKPAPESAEEREALDFVRRLIEKP